MSEYPRYRHKKGGIYDLIGVVRAARDYAEGQEFHFTQRYWSKVIVTDPIRAGEFVACYQVPLELATLDNPAKLWARPAEMFFDGRFQRIP